MLEAFRKAFKIKDIRKKIGYTFLMLIVIRIGSQLPTPGVNGEYIKNFFAQNTGEAFNLFNAFTGGSFEQMSVFALSITPYITSSIIVQLLTIAIPQLEEMQRDGETGRKKIVAITRYLTVGLALIESGAMAVGFGRQGLLVKYNFVNAAIVVLTLTAGSAFLMWIGERITENAQCPTTTRLRIFILPPWKSWRRWATRNTKFPISPAPALKAATTGSIGTAAIISALAPRRTAAWAASALPRRRARPRSLPRPRCTNPRANAPPKITSCSSSVFPAGFH